MRSSISALEAGIVSDDNWYGASFSQSRSNSTFDRILLHFLLSLSDFSNSFYLYSSE